MSEPLPSLQRLSDEFERVSRQRRATTRFRRRTVLFAAIAALSVSAAAAASGILTGDPVKAPPGTPKPRPDVWTGVARASTLTGLRVADPGGGPPWGLRTITTSREFGCVQVGRVVDGRLGVLGQDQAFGNDGRFHEMSAEVMRDNCALLDGAGRLFIAMSVQGTPASGQPYGCAVRPPPKLPPPLRKTAAGRKMAATPLCRRENVRILYYGTLGPQAKSVTYKDQGVLKTAATSGPLGAYLVVLRPNPYHPPRGYFSPGVSPASGLHSITYRDGHSCRIRKANVIGGATACPRVGYVRVRAEVPDPRQIATPVRATVSRTPVAVGSGPKNWAIYLSFKARVAAGPRSFYSVTMMFPRHGCGNSAGGGMVGPIARNIRAGELVKTTLYAPAECKGIITGEVRFQSSSSSRQQSPFMPANPARSPLVGKYTTRIPKR